MTPRAKLKKLNKSMEVVLSKQEEVYDYYNDKSYKLNELINKILYQLFLKEKLLKLTEWKFTNYLGDYRLISAISYLDPKLKKIFMLFRNAEGNRYINVDFKDGVSFSSDDSYYYLTFDNADYMYKFIKKNKLKINIDEMVAKITELKKNLGACESLFKIFENDWNMRQVLE